MNVDIASRAPISGRPERRETLRRRAPELLAVSVLLVATGVCYGVGLGINGWGNSYYAAAAQAGAESWQAFFFGASDAPGSITIDKPPASIWLMALSIRLLGLSPVAVMLPQVLLGVATVAFVYLTVRRVGRPGAALLAGAIVATTPVAVLVFRYDNPDALLTALLALAAYAATRAVERARLRWIVVVGLAFGFAFLTKQLQAFLVYPGLVVCHLLAAPVGLWARVRQVCVAVLCTILGAGWWIAIVQMVPADRRPYIGGSTTNSFLELTVGANGFGRLLGGSSGTTGSTWGALRMVTGATAPGVAWLLPAALALGVVALVLGRHRPRTDSRRAVIVGSLIGLVVSVLAFSFMRGTYHSYYCAAMVPALAITIGASAQEVWTHRSSRAVRIVLAAVVGVTAAWNAVLLSHALGYQTLAIAVTAIAGATVTVLLAVLPGRRGRYGVVAAGAAVTLLVAPLAVSFATAATSHSGPSPVVAKDSVARAPADPVVVETLRQTEGSSWVAATDTAQQAAAYQLASGKAVMGIGGYNGQDPSPTLEQFQSQVAHGRVHWFIGDHGVIGQWVASRYTPIRVGDTILYDLSTPPHTAVRATVQRR